MTVKYSFFFAIIQNTFSGVIVGGVLNHFFKLLHFDKYIPILKEFSIVDFVSFVHPNDIVAVFF